MNEHSEIESYSTTIRNLKTLMSDDVNRSLNDSLIEDQDEKNSALGVAKNQNKYIHQLEKEVTFLRDQLAVLKQNVKETVSENDHLRQQLAKSFAASVQSQLDSLNSNEEKNESQHSDNELWQKWQADLERIRSVYQATSKHLEQQANELRFELEQKKQQIENLKSELKACQSDQFINSSAPGIGTQRVCVVCAHRQALISPIDHEQSLHLQDHKLTKEKEELETELNILRTKLKDAEIREENCHDQVKSSVLIVEQAQFEKTQVEAENVNLKQRMKLEEDRLKDIVNEYKLSLKREREMVTKEWSQRLVAMQQKVTQMNDDQAHLEAKLESSEKEKIRISEALTLAKSQLEHLDKQMAELKSSTRLQIEQLHTERQYSADNFKRFLNDKDLLIKSHKQEVDAAQFKIEVAERKLEATERKLSDSQHQCISLTQAVTQLEKQANVAILSKQNIEKSRTDDVKSISQKADQQIEKLTEQLGQLQYDHSAKIDNMDEIISSQSSLINQLMQESKQLVDRLEKLSRDSWQDKCEAMEEKADLANRLQAALNRLEVYDQAHNKHIDQEATLKQQLINSEELSRKNSAQVYELLQKQMLLDQERHQLKGEVNFLHHELISLGRPRSSAI